MGGTNYYIESLLWDILVSPSSSSLTENDDFKDAADDDDDNGDGDGDVVAANVVCKTTSDNTPATVSENVKNVCIHAILLLNNILFMFFFFVWNLL